MTADRSRAFFASALLHGTVLAIALYFSYAAVAEQAKKAPRILELVAAEGDNFRATAAPAIGIPGGVKLVVPKMTPRPVVAEPPQPEPPKPEPAKAEPPAKPEPSPLSKAPVTPPPTSSKTETPKRTTAQIIRRQLANAALKGRNQAKKEIDAEQKRLTKEEFDKAQRAKVASAKTNPSTKYEKIDSEGIAKGVIGGSTKNKTGGAGGTALSVEERSEADAYAAYLNQKLTDELDSIPGLDENLRAEAEFEVLGSGRLARGRIIKRSGNERFDQAVLHAIATVRMAEGPPKGFERVQQVAFSSKGKN